MVKITPYNPTMENTPVRLIFSSSRIKCPVLWVKTERNLYQPNFILSDDTEFNFISNQPSQLSYLTIEISLLLWNQHAIFKQPFNLFTIESLVNSISISAHPSDLPLVNISVCIENFARFRRPPFSPFGFYLGSIGELKLSFACLCPIFPFACVMAA